MRFGHDLTPVPQRLNPREWDRIGGTAGSRALSRSIFEISSVQRHEGLEEKNWLPPRDSNPDMLIQSQLSCR